MLKCTDRKNANNEEGPRKAGWIFLMTFQWWIVEENWVGKEMRKETVGGERERVRWRDSREDNGNWWCRGAEGIFMTCQSSGTVGAPRMTIERL